MFKNRIEAQGVNNSSTAQSQSFATLLRSIKPADNLLDYKLKHLIEVLRDNLEILHDGINEEEPRNYLLNQSKSVTLVCDELLTKKSA